jgi:dTDP-4-dehydrorhamnose reductase
MKILVFGATGMLGNAVIRVLSEIDNWEVFGTVRTEESKRFFHPEHAKNLIVGCEVTNYSDLVKVFNQINPQVVINCISLSKQLLKSADPLKMIPIFSLLPHQLAMLCKNFGARLVQMSSDGVFSGKKGGYIESDPSDAQDIYGSTKYIGEVHQPHAITIRTSIIGHELQSKNGLVEWFLSQEGQCVCFSRAIFSGFPAVVLAQIIRDIVIPNTDLNGVYHIASSPISKCDLLRLIAKVYGKKIKLIPNDKLKIDRSLNAENFRIATGYTPPDWQTLVKLMHIHQ